MEALTVTIIACNEADRIGRAIQSVSFADEVLVVDSGSQDATVEVARSLGARVIETDWPGYREQKNRAVQWAKNDWVLGLDADEWVSPQLGDCIQSALKNPGLQGFAVNRLGLWMGPPSAMVCGTRIDPSGSSIDAVESGQAVMFMNAWRYRDEPGDWRAI